jgi:hypothetical protein
MTSYPDWKPGVEIGADTTSGESITLPYRERLLGVAMIGKSGRGKSTTLEHLILADIQQGTAAVAIDPHGVLAKRVAGLVSPEYAERLILVEVNEEVAFGLNMLDIEDKARDSRVTWAADNVVGTIKRLYDEDAQFQPRLEEFLDLAVRTLIPSGRTLVDAYDLFEDEAFREECLSHVTSPVALRKLRRRWSEYTQLRPADRLAHRETVRNRLERLLAPELIQTIVGSKHTTLPLERVLNGNDTMIISLPSSEWLSQERADFIGSLILCVLVYHIFSRDLDYEQPRLHLYLDEYQRFASSATAELLTQGRKYNVGTTFAHQDLAQITDARVRDAFRHAGAIIALGLTRPDADMLTGEFPVKARPERLETLRVPDGVEAREIITQTPGHDSIVKVHSDPAVRQAAGMLFSRELLPVLPEFSALTDTFGKVRDPRFEIFHDKLDPFLISVMSGEVAPTPEAIVQALWEMDYPPGTESVSELFDSGRWPGWFHASGTHSPGSESEDFRYGMYSNREYERLRERECQEFYDRLMEWFFTLTRDDAPVRATELIEYATEHEWSGEGEARANVKERHFWFWRSGGAVGVAEKPEKRVIAERRAQITAHVAFLCERFLYQQQWLTILAEGLATRPITINASDVRPRERISYILHAPQGSSDALTEWAGELTNPSELHIAKVRLLTGAHEVKLAPPVGGTVNVSQIKAIRARSQKLYAVTEAGEEETTPPVTATPEDTTMPIIGRRPIPPESPKINPQDKDE